MFHLHRSPFRLAAFAAVGGLLLCARTSFAASQASDSASNAIYSNNGFINGSNGGTGFGAWAFTNTDGGTTNGNNSGEFTGNSGNNGGGNPNGNGGGIGNPAFGFYSGGSDTAIATRAFTGMLSVGQSFSLQLDNGYENTGGIVGFSLLTSSGGNLTTANPRFQYFYQGDTAPNAYRVVGSTTQYTSGGFTDNGMSTTFTLTGTNTFSFSVTFNGGGTESFTGTLGGTAGSGIAGFELMSSNVGTGGQNDAYFNTPTITGTGVPEPSTWAAVLLGGVLCTGLRHRARADRADIVN